MLCRGSHQMAVWLSAGGLASLCLCFLIYPVVIQIVPASSSSFEDELVTV